MERPAKFPRLAEDSWDRPTATTGAELGYRSGDRAAKESHANGNEHHHFQQHPHPYPYQPSQQPDSNGWEDFDEDDYDTDFDELTDQNYFDILPDDFSHSFAGTLLNRATKRSHQTAFDESHVAVQLSPSVARDFPEFLPRIPSPRARSRAELDVENPFAANDGALVHPAMQRLRDPLIAAQAVIMVNGFIKARFHVPPPEKRRELSKVPLIQFHRLHQPNQQAQVAGPVQDEALLGPPQLPPHFGDVTMLDQLDRKLFEFFTSAVCKGRTVIVNDNTYLKQIAPMAEGNKGVKHAILALAASYVLDYSPNELLQSRANHHYRESVRLLDQDLRKSENRASGKGEALIASLILMGHNECINWEIDRRKEQLPKWYRAAILAEEILDASSPAVDYELPNNVQLTRARSQLANRVCLDSVLCHCVYPFDARSIKCEYAWLILGTDKERRRIIGFTGLSSELMHYFVKITVLSARRFKIPSSQVTPPVGHQIEKVLTNFWQWSELSEDFTTSEALLESCELDEAGKVTTNIKVTELVGESYVSAAQIYLQCRFFRRRRDNPVVQKLLWKLLRTIEYQPTSGVLFTAQTPLFSVFIGGLVAYKKEDRDVIRAWFDPICTGSRGNVPPTYEALKHMWLWLDDYWRERGEVDGGRMGNGVEERGKGKEKEQEQNEDEQHTSTDEVKADNSDAWWEDMVTELSARYGRINLA